MTTPINSSSLPAQTDAVQKRSETDNKIASAVENPLIQLANMMSRANRNPAGQL